MRVDIDGPLSAEWMSGRTALVTGGGAYLLGERGIRINAVELGALWTAGVAARS